MEISRAIGKFCGAKFELVYRGSVKNRRLLVGCKPNCKLPIPSSEILSISESLPDAMALRKNRNTKADGDASVDDDDDADYAQQLLPPTSTEQKLCLYQTLAFVSTSILGLFLVHDLLLQTPREKRFFTLIVGIPLWGAVFTWFHIWLALKMIFVPTEFVGLVEVRAGLGLGWQGVIPRKCERMARIAYGQAKKYILTLEEILDRVDSHELLGELEGELDKVLLENIKENFWATLEKQSRGPPASRKHGSRRAEGNAAAQNEAVFLGRSRGEDAAIAIERGAGSPFSACSAEKVAGAEQARPSAATGAVAQMARGGIAGAAVAKSALLLTRSSNKWASGVSLAQSSSWLESDAESEYAQHGNDAALRGPSSSLSEDLLRERPDFLPGLEVVQLQPEQGNAKTALHGHRSAAAVASPKESLGDSGAAGERSPAAVAISGDEQASSSAHLSRLRKIVPDKFFVYLKDLAKEELKSTVEPFVKTIKTTLVADIDVEEFVVSAFRKNKALLCEFFEVMGAEEFKFIQNCGAAAGFFMGIFQLVIFSKLERDYGFFGCAGESSSDVGGRGPGSGNSDVNAAVDHSSSSVSLGGTPRVVPETLPNVLLSEPGTLLSRTQSIQSIPSMYIFLPLSGLVIGLLTNYLAIQACFRPVDPIFVHLPPSRIAQSRPYFVFALFLARLFSFFAVVTRVPLAGLLVTKKLLRAIARVTRGIVVFLYDKLRWICGGGIVGVQLDAALEKERFVVQVGQISNSKDNNYISRGRADLERPLLGNGMNSGRERDDQLSASSWTEVLSSARLLLRNSARTSSALPPPDNNDVTPSYVAPGFDDAGRHVGREDVARFVTPPSSSDGGATSDDERAKKTGSFGTASCGPSKLLKKVSVNFPNRISGHPKNRGDNSVGSSTRNRHRKSPRPFLVDDFEYDSERIRREEAELEVLIQEMVAPFREGLVPATPADDNSEVAAIGAVAASAGVAGGGRSGSAGGLEGRRTEGDRVGAPTSDVRWESGLSRTEVARVARGPLANGEKNERGGKMRAKAYKKRLVRVEKDDDFQNMHPKAREGFGETAISGNRTTLPRHEVVAPPRTTLKLQGLFLQRQKDVCGLYSHLLTLHFLNLPNMIGYMRTANGGCTWRTLEKKYDDFVASAFLKCFERTKLSSFGKLFNFSMSSAQRRFANALRAEWGRAVDSHGKPLEERRATSLTSVFMDYFERKTAIEATNRKRLEKMRAEEFEQLLRPVFVEDEWILITLGGVLGLFVGLVQCYLLGN